MLRRRLALVAIVALALSSCAPAPATPAKVFDVQVDARATGFSLAAGMYFPRDLAVHAGDTVRFTAVDRGSIHTVTFGKLVDAALQTFERLPPSAARPALKELGLPPVVVGDPPTALGRTATQPCFLDAGASARPDGCRPEERRQPELSGSQDLFNSGYLAGGDVFAVRLSASLKPGAYGFICLLHGPEMSGRVVVEPRDRAVPEPADVTARGSEQLGAVVRQVQPLVDTRARDLPPATIAAGIPVPATSHTQATVFRPADLTLPRAGAVTWELSGVHTISFNAPQDAVGLVVRASDRSWALNARLLAPEPATERALGGADGPRNIDGGIWDGRGFRNSGLIDADGRPRTYRLAFSEPGTYTYKCLLHPDMEGTIRVVQR